MTPNAGKPTPRPESFLGVRHLQALLIFLGMLVAYTLRVNLSVAIVAMVDKEHANPDFQEFAWDEGTKAVLLSSFFWGYVITQVPAGQLAERFGPKNLLAVAILMTSLFSMLTPWAAATGDWPLVCAMRVLQGITQGFLFPCSHALLARWMPVTERGTLVTFAYSGSQVGTFLSLPLCALLATSAAGWPSAFYVFGILGVAWAVLWFILGSNSPAQHSFITKQERDYIEDSINAAPPSDHRQPTPWKAIATSMPIWALIFSSCAQAWGFWTLLTEMPSFMKSVLHFDLKSNGLLSALPYFSMWLLGLVLMWVSHFINKKELLSLTASRKMFNSIGQWGPAVVLVCLAYTTDSILAVVFLTLAVGLNSAPYLGSQVNHIDLAPNYAGTTMGITNASSNMMSMLGPLLVGAIVTESGSVSQWRIVFIIAAVVYFLGNLAFLIFGRAELQPWNEPGYLDKEAFKVATNTHGQHNVFVLEVKEEL